MGETPRPMHGDFARWYATVSIDDAESRRRARWDGVLTVLEDTDRTRVEALLRLAYGGRAAPAAEEVQKIREAFRAADETFEMRGNDRELQVLAGAALAVLMEDVNESEGAAAALAATTASLAGARKPNVPMDLASLGEAAIRRQGDAKRKRPDLAKLVSVEPPKVDFKRASTKVREQANWDGVVEAFGMLAEAASAGLAGLAKRQANTISSLESFLKTQDEELQMLWWLTGEYSDSYGCSLKDVPADAQPFVMGSELAESTQFLPGPPSITAILSRAGLKERRKLAVTRAVNAPRADWLERLMTDAKPSALSTPLHEAIKRQLETGAGDAWVSGWAASAGIDATLAVSSVTLGELFYRERLLFLFE
jgi:hypothetical protein